MLSFSNEDGEEEEEDSSGNILPTKMISAPQTKNYSKKKLNSKNKNIDEIKNENDKKIENKNENKNENEKDFDEAKYEKMLRDAKKKAAQYNFDDEDDDDDDDDKNDEKTIKNGGEGEGEEKGEKRGGEEGGAGDSFRGHYEDSEEARKKKMLKEKGNLSMILN